MRNTILSWFLLPLLVSLSLSPQAAPLPVVSEPTMADIATPHTEKVNLNQADAWTLQKIMSGVGKAKAEAIVSYRDAHGSFNSVDELLEIKGIGNALLERNRDRLTVD